MDDTIAVYVKTQEDLAFEYELQSNGDDIVVWKRYLEHRKACENPAALAWVYERCCYHFPGDCSMWLEYLQWRVALLVEANAVIFAGEFEKCNKLFEKAMYLCYQDVGIWELYLRHCVKQRNLGFIRDVLNRALQNVPLEHHIRLWAPVVELIETLLQNRPEHEFADPDLEFIVQQALKESSSDLHAVPKDLWSSHLLARYIQVAEEQEHILRLIGLTGDHHTISKVYNEKIILRKDFKPVERPLFGFYELYLNALESTCGHQRYNQIMAQCLEMFPEQSSTLVITLSIYFIKRRKFNEARNVLQDSLSSTTSMNSFSRIYDFLVKFLEVYVSSCMDLAQHEDGYEQQHIQLDREISFNIEVLENLMDSHSLLVSDLRLRQNVNDVKVWMDRVQLYSGLQEKLHVYTDALVKINPALVTEPAVLGKLWCNLGDLYISNGQIDFARESFERSTRVPFRFLQDLENVWHKWAEMEVECSRLPDALKILKRALVLPESPDLVVEKYESVKSGIPVQAVLFTSLKLWSFYIDLLEVSSNTAKVVEAYENIISLKLATPVHFINYAHFWQERDGWDDSFKIYERALVIFPGAVRLDLWRIYLKVSTDRLRPAETMRDLFEQAVLLAGEGMDCSDVFIQYGEFEEKQGMQKRCIDILVNGSTQIRDETSKLRLWSLCLEKCKSFLGLKASRDLYTKCIQNLPNSKVIPFVLDFAGLEETLGDIARARAVLRFGAQLAHPSSNTKLWDYWNELELRHGDKISFKEMLRTKRGLSDSLKVSTEDVSREDGNVEFVVSKAGSNLEPEQTTVNPAEISLDI
ncbi:mRNA splicing protein SYF1 LALA0_S06e05556g [Lachancea lanzarotensis]|uniref:Pre-mRNA-splicing factor SYF1 n=1 Tax=Lachancea lanzarotensis TaxID=1245769 RepID=A0A0C7N4G4_9SACH|nr:uncharacterized protein LALA0_S06e05556g [Lachancea lanzarotensis]CEP62862.1 LALA0S06e05556g1_1 [Lachancea lanzarotensis]